MTIELLTKELIEEIENLYEATKQNMIQVDLDQWDEQYPHKDIYLKDIEEKTFYGAFHGHTLVACITVNKVQSPEYKNVSWQLEDGAPLVVHRLCVHPDHRGQKIAQHVMNWVYHFATSNGYKSIRLDAFQLNPTSNHLYHKLGYDLVGEVTFRKGKFNCYEMPLN